jgi:hypothetical protein
VRSRKFGVFLVVAFLLACASTTALAAKPKQARFRVTLTGTLTKTWAYTHSEGEPGCILTTRGSGKWEAKVSTRQATRIRIVAVRGGKLRFSGSPIRTVAGTTTRSGTHSVTGQGSPNCERQSKTARCAGVRRSFRGGSSGLVNPRRGVLQLGRLRTATAIRSFSPPCPEEPSEIRSIQTDLTLATGPIAAADVFSRDVPRFFVSGDSEQETALSGDIDGTVTERVRWTVTFTRLH